MKQLAKFEKYFGKKINRVGLGGIPIQRLNDAESDKLIKYCFENGINFVDTARGYTTSEQKLGNILKKIDKKIFIATKSMARTYEEMKRDIKISLDNLQVDCIDLYQFHFVNKEEDLNKILDKENGAYRACIEAQENGLIKFIGITGHIPATLVKAVKTGKFESVQIPHNILETECEKELLPLCEKNSIPVLAMKPVAGGALSKVTYNIRYILNNGSTIAIPGMDKIEQIDENMSVLPDIKQLSEKEMDELLKEKEVWSGEFCRRCEYCMPCPNSLNIPFLLLLQAYKERYNLDKWVNERFASLPKVYSDCTHCKACERKCPYNLPISDMMTNGYNLIEKGFKA